MTLNNSDFSGMTLEAVPENIRIRCDIMAEFEFEGRRFGAIERPVMTLSAKCICLDDIVEAGNRVGLYSFVFARRSDWQDWMSGSMYCDMTCPLSCTPIGKITLGTGEII